MNNRYPAYLWLGLVALLVLFLVLQFTRGISLETDVMELLPGENQAEEIGVLTRMFRGDLGKSLFVTLPDQQDEDGQMQTTVVEQLREADPIREVHVLSGRRRARAFYDYYFPKRYQVLADSTRRRLQEQEPTSRVIERIQRRLRGFTFPLDSQFLDRDPLLLFPALLSQWMDQLPGERMPMMDSGKVTILATLEGNPFRPTVQNQVQGLMERLQSEVIAADSSDELEWTGVVKFARISRVRMLQDMSLISTLSTLAIVLLIFFSFRSLRHLLVLATSLVSGFVAAFGVSLWWFPNLHLVTVTFGASLIGVCVDYSFHYFVEAERDPDSALVRVLPGISLGLFTTVIAYATLSLTPFPALRQMAVFSTVGLVGAFVPVIVWYPYLIPGGSGNSNRLYLRTISRGMLGAWRQVRQNQSLALLGGVFLLMVFGVGFFTLEFTDDVRQLGNVPEQLIDQDRSIRSESGFVDTGRYLLVTGDTPQQVLRREERTRSTLVELRGDGVLAGSLGLTTFVPSMARQQADRGVLRSYLEGNREDLKDQLITLGFSPETIRSMVEQIRSPLTEYLTVDSWLEHGVSVGFRPLWLGEVDGEVGSVVVLRQIQQAAPLRKLAANNPGVFYHNRLQTFQDLLEKYRWEAMGLIGLSYLVISLVLAVWYGWLKGILSLLPALLGGMVTISVLSIAGYDLHIMHVVSLMLILGMGVDYGVFLMEGIRTSRELTSITRAILLSAVSTIFSFGLLALSENPILHSIGMTVFIGMIAMLTLAPMPVLLENR